MCLVQWGASNKLKRWQLFWLFFPSHWEDECGRGWHYRRFAVIITLRVLNIFKLLLQPIVKRTVKREGRSASAPARIRDQSCEDTGGGSRATFSGGSLMLNFAPLWELRSKVETEAKKVEWEVISVSYLEDEDLTLRRGACGLLREGSAVELCSTATVAGLDETGADKEVWAATLRLAFLEW